VSFRRISLQRAPVTYCGSLYACNAAPLDERILVKFGVHSTSSAEVNFGTSLDYLASIFLCQFTWYRKVWRSKVWRSSRPRHRFGECCVPWYERVYYSSVINNTNMVAMQTSVVGTASKVLLFFMVMDVWKCETLLSATIGSVTKCCGGDNSWIVDIHSLFLYGDIL
jgi:hypothetical protein